MLGEKRYIFILGVLVIMVAGFGASAMMMGKGKGKDIRAVPAQVQKGEGVVSPAQPAKPAYKPPSIDPPDVPDPVLILPVE